MLSRVEGLVAIIWAGVLWTVCGVVAPTLFAVLDDRELAGRLAGTFFEIGAWLGLAAGGLLALAQFARRRWRPDRWLIAWIGAAALLPIGTEALLGPLMKAARSGATATSFAALHGMAAVAFALACVALLGVVLRLTRPAA